MELIDSTIIDGDGLQFSINFAKRHKNTDGTVTLSLEDNINICRFIDLLLDKELPPKEEVAECLCDSPGKFCVKHQKYVQFSTKDDSPKEEVAEEATYIKCGMCGDHIPVELMPNICYDCACKLKSEPKKIEKLDLPVNGERPTNYKLTDANFLRMEDKINEIILHFNKE